MILPLPTYGLKACVSAAAALGNCSDTVFASQHQLTNGSPQDAVPSCLGTQALPRAAQEVKVTAEPKDTVATLAVGSSAGSAVPALLPAVAAGNAGAPEEPTHSVVVAAAAVPDALAAVVPEEVAVVPEEVAVVPVAASAKFSANRSLASVKAVVLPAALAVAVAAGSVQGVAGIAAGAAGAAELPEPLRGPATAALLLFLSEQPTPRLSARLQTRASGLLWICILITCNDRVLNL